MAANAPTIFYPQIDPAPRIQVEYLNAWGGVYAEADNITSVTLWTDKLPTKVYIATLTQLYDEFGNPSIGNYEWTANNIQLVGGVNRLFVKNLLDTGDNAVTEVSMLVDFIAPTISTTFPANASINNSTVYQIRVRFSEDMDPVTTVNGLHIYPDPGGYWYPWYGNATDFIYSVPGSQLEYGTLYTVSTSADARDVIGNSTTSTGFSFKTMPAPAHEAGKSVGYAEFYTTAPFEIPIVGEDASAVTTLTPGIANPFRYFLLDGAETSYNIPYNDSYYDISPIANDASVFTTLSPGIVSPFRYFINDGKNIGHGASEHASDAIYLPKVGDESFALTTLSPGLLDPFRKHIKDGYSKGYYFFKYNLTPLPWYPTILDYDIMNYVTLEGYIHVMTDNIPVMEWAVPNAMRNRRIFYTCQFSRYVSFSKFMAFDSYQNVDAFKYSADRENWELMPTTGTKRKVGYVRFTSPAQIEGGLWYFRILAGYKRTVS